MIDEENQIFYIVFENDKDHRTKVWWYPDGTEIIWPIRTAQIEPISGPLFLNGPRTGPNIPVKAYDLAHTDNAIKEGKAAKEEIFVGDVYFDKALKARVKILNKNEKDAFTVQGRFQIVQQYPVIHRTVPIRTILIVFWEF